MELVNKIVQMNKRVIIALVAFAVCGSMTVSALSAKAANEETTTETVVQIGSTSASDKALASATIVSNYRTVSKAKIKQAKDQGRCKHISGQQAIKMGVQTQGYMGSGTGYAPENRPTTMCDTNGDGKYDVRAECGNRLIYRAPQPEKAKATIWVDNMSTAKAKIKVTAFVKVKAKCDTGGASASATAKAKASAYASVKLKNIVKGKGKIDGEGLVKIKAKAKAKAEADAKAKAKATADVMCKETKTTTTTTTKNETPGTPGESTPVASGKGVEELPNTGPGAVAAAFVGFSSLGSLAYSYVSRRFGL
jgi:hypothetical protein